MRDRGDPDAMIEDGELQSGSSLLKTQLFLFCVLSETRIRRRMTELNAQARAAVDPDAQENRPS